MFQSDQKIDDCISRINSLKHQCAKFDDDIAHIENQIESLSENDEAESEFLQAVAQQQHDLEILVQSRQELWIEGEGLEKEIERIQDYASHAQIRLFSEMKETLAEGGLLEPVEEPRVPIQQLDNISEDGLLSKPTPTPSEAERFALEDARENALNLVTEKQIQLGNAREQFDSLQDHYNEEHNTWLALVSEGRLSSSKTVFDALMLQDAREFTANLIQAEKRSSMHAITQGNLV